MKRLSLLILLAAVSACGDATASNGDRPGTATVSLMNNNAGDGAIALTVRGPGLSTVVALDSNHVVFARLASPTELKVIVLGDSIPPGPLFALPVGASNRPAAYTVAVDQVALVTDSLRSDIAGYQASLAASPN